MPRIHRLLPALLAVTLLAGCSDPQEEAGDPATSTTSTGSSTTQAPAAVLDIELANETLDFAAANGGAADSLEVDVPSTHGNVTVRFQILADCPSGYAASSPRLVAVDADGAEMELWAYDTVVPDATEPYNCPLGDPTGGREREAGVVDVSAVPGSFTLRTEGEFTGEVEVAIIASA